MICTKNARLPPIAPAMARSFVDSSTSRDCRNIAHPSSIAAAPNAACMHRNSAKIRRKMIVLSSCRHIGVALDEGLRMVVEVVVYAERGGE